MNLLRSTESSSAKNCSAISLVSTFSSLMKSLPINEPVVIDSPSYRNIWRVETNGGNALIAKKGAPAPSNRIRELVMGMAQASCQVSTAPSLAGIPLPRMAK